MVVRLPSDISPQQTWDILKQHILVDGFHVVADPQASRGAYIHDTLLGADFLDFYSYFATQPIGYNHPRMREADFQARLLIAATTKVANADVYTKYYADFVKTMADVAGLPGMDRFFFIDGGAHGGGKRAQGGVRLEGPQESRRRSWRDRIEGHPLSPGVSRPQRVTHSA
jgi:hypothetical protein